MDNSIYEVDMEDYKNFLEQLDTTKMHKEEAWMEQVHIIKIISNKTNKHLCSRISDDELEETHFYVFNYPDDDERIAPKPTMKIQLETREEV